MRILAIQPTPTTDVSLAIGSNRQRIVALAMVALSSQQILFLEIGIVLERPVCPLCLSEVRKWISRLNWLALQCNWIEFRFRSNLNRRALEAGWRSAPNPTDVGPELAVP